MTDALKIGDKCQCPDHGELPWLGTVICVPGLGGCGRVMWIGGDDSDRHPDYDPTIHAYVCRCTKPVNDGWVRGRPAFRGVSTRIVVDAVSRPICIKCYLDRLRAEGTEAS